MVNQNTFNENDTVKSQSELAAAEAHHRVKNTLQNIISYINIMFSRKESIKKEEIHKLTHYIHSLSALHDILHNEVKSGNDGKNIHINKVLSDCIQVQSLQKNIICSDIPEIVGPTRHAASLSLIVNELLDFFASFGSQELFVEFERCGDGMVVMVMREGCTMIEEKDLTTDLPQGVQVAEMLAKSDLQNSIEWVQRHRPLSLRLKIPINQKV